MESAIPSCQWGLRGAVLALSGVSLAGPVQSMGFTSAPGVIPCLSKAGRFVAQMLPKVLSEATSQLCDLCHQGESATWIGMSGRWQVAQFSLAFLRRVRLFL